MTVKCVKTMCHKEGVAVSFWYRSHYNEEAWNILCSHILCVSFEMCGTAILCEYTSIKRMLNLYELLIFLYWVSGTRNGKKISYTTNAL